MTAGDVQPAGRDIFAERLTSRHASLAPAARRVVEFIDQNRAVVLASSAMDLAGSTGTSDATVVRSVQALGFSGLPELKQALLTTVGRSSTPADDMRRTLEEIGPGTANAVDLVLDAHMEAVASLRVPQGRSQALDAISVLHPVERIVVFGMGPSAALAEYASILLGRTGRRSRTLNRTGTMLADQMLDLRVGDALLVLAYGRAYREVAAVFGEARRLSLPIVLMTDNAHSKLALAANTALIVPRGRAGRVALHGATMVGLEALVLGLTAADQGAALTTLQRLNDLRRAVSGQQKDAG